MFRIQGKHIFLTYPRAENIESKAHLLWALRDKIPTPLNWAIAQENHQDGGIHYHCLLSYANRIDIRDVAFFDYNGHHPNIQSARSQKQVLAYVIKDDADPLVHGFDLRQEDDIYTIVQEEIGHHDNPTQALQVIMDRGGTKALRMYNNIAAYVDRVMRPSAVHDPIYDWPLSFPLTDVYLDNIIDKFLQDIHVGAGPRGNRKSLWLYGASRLGKTMLARSLGRHWYMQGSWNVDCYDDNAEYGVLDDIEWDNIKRYYKGILGLQSDVTVTDKYKKKSVIRGGKPVIMITNELPVFTVHEALWLETNVVFHAIATKVY